MWSDSVNPRFGPLAAWLALVLTAAATQPASAEARCSFLVDVSGSMAGFHAPGAPQQAYVRLVQTVASICPSTYVFTTGEPNPVADVANAPAEPRDTQLKVPFDWWLRTSDPGDIVFFLTDNIADDREGESSRAQEDFYELVRSTDKGLAGAEVHALRLPFRGRVFSLDMATATPYSDYSGERAVALYLIAKAAPETGEMALRYFLAMRRKVIEMAAAAVPNSSNRHRFTVRPFESLESGLAATPVSTDLAVKMSGQTISGTTARFDSAKHTLYVDKLPRGERLTIPVLLTLQPGPNFNIDDVEVTADFVTPPSAVGPGRTDAAKVMPSSVNIRAGQPVKIRIWVPVRPFDWTDRPTVLQRLKRLFGEPQIVNGRIEVRYHAVRRNIVISDPVRTDWHTENRAELGLPIPDVQRRIYRLEPLLQGMATSGSADSGQGLAVPLAPIKVKFRLIGSTLDIATLLAALALLLAIAVALLVYFSKHRDYELGGHFGNRSFKLGAIGTWQCPAVAGLRILILRVGPLLFVVWSGGKVMPIPGIMSAEGGVSHAPVRGAFKPSFTLRIKQSAAAGTRPLSGPFGRSQSSYRSFKP